MSLPTTTPGWQVPATATRLAGGKVRVDSPGGAAIYDVTRLDQFGRFPLVHGSSNSDRRDCVSAYVASLGCEALVGFHTVEHDGTGHLDEWGNDVEPVACGVAAVILLDSGTDTMPVCEAHR